MSEEDYSLLVNRSFDELTDEEIETIYSMIESVREVLQFNSIDLEPSIFFTWMYTLQPSAEA